jgi:penicillin-binding protein 1C
MKRRSKIYLGILTLLLIFFLLFWFSLPSKLFKDPTSTILEDKKGELLAAKIAADGQWRFPVSDSVPNKFALSIITFEDKNFRNHIGVDFLSIGNSAWQNIKNKRIVRGGSTLTMQVIRLSRKNKRRSFLEKLIEITQALRLEVTLSKKEILTLYASNAPFGGNVVGLEAASWRYFNAPSSQLSWAEAAALAVLPNSPALIFPGKNELIFLKKRNRLLKSLHEKGHIDKMSYELALKEPLAGKPYALPVIAPHLLAYSEKKGMKGKRIKSTINIHLQKTVNKILAYHQERLSANGVYNAAALILDVKTGKVLTYGGNILSDQTDDHGYSVDLIQARRSTGSILKPLLFGMLLTEGKLLNTSLVADIPTLIGGYAPKNYFLTYDGAVAFKQSIARSLNVPAVRILQEYGVEKFHHNLKKLGMSTLNKPHTHYGLSLILGGAEGTLWDLAGIYRNMAFSLNDYHLNHKFRLKTEKPSFISEKENQNYCTVFDAGSIWLTFEAMNEVSRPEEDASWRDFSSAYKIAWKTGTSYGNRDAWAIGCTPQYVVAVWAGNADGEGRPDLTGIGSAAPILFDIFKHLKSQHWFLQPFNEMVQTEVCIRSGFKASENCKERTIQWTQKASNLSGLCPYHKLVHLDEAEQYRVSGECESVRNMHTKSLFVLPPAMEYYFKNKNASYKTLPPYREDCMAYIANRSFEILYPSYGSKIFIPVEIDERKGKTVFEVAHRNPSKELFWSIDNIYIGSTKDFHQLAVNPDPGEHYLTVTDESGESKRVKFEVIER